jgi:trehalose 2-sulfotransferase
MITSYIICTTPRSGSTLLCKLLASTKRTGSPNSFYHRAEFMHEWATEWHLPDASMVPKNDFEVAYLAAAVRAGKAGTEIFGLRLQKAYVTLLSDTLDRIFPGLPSDAHRFKQAFGEILYIHLTRVDKVAQAVSLVKAKQSGLWHLNADGTELERLTVPQEPRYDFGSIHREAVALERDDGAWVEWFDRHGISPLEIRYEAFAEHPARTLIDICKALGKEPPEAGLITPSLAKLSDAVSLEWIRRYKADLTQLGV